MIGGDTLERPKHDSKHSKPKGPSKSLLDSRCSFENSKKSEKFEFRFKLGMQPDISHTLNQAFEFASQYGFHHIELLMDHPNFYHENISHVEVVELKGSYDLDVLIHASATATNFISISSEMRKASYRELEKTIFFADRCEAKLITFHLGWNPGFITSRGFIFKKDWYSKHNHRVIKEEMGRFLRSVEDKKDNILLCLENTIDMDEMTKKAIEDVLQETDLHLTFDAGHWNVKSSHDIFIKHFDRVRNIHLHDNRGDLDTHMTLGKGSLDLSMIPFERYDGFVTLELRDEKATVESKDHLERYLRKCWRRE